jgi:serpin B
MYREWVAFTSYYEDKYIQALPLFFNTSGGLLIILPKEGGANEYLASMDAERFNDIMGGLKPMRGSLLLPKFAIDSKPVDLNEPLINIGVPEIFFTDSRNAPLTELINEDICYISKVVQKALINVDEEGTTAAAVTVIVVNPPSSGPLIPEETFEMICDRPFVFILFSRTTDGGSQILFMGTVNKPITP